MQWGVAAALPGLLLWSIVLCLLWRAWGTREFLDVDAPEERGADGAATPLSGVTALIPARNEAMFIGATLTALQACCPRLQIILIDDQSDDGTAQRARQIGLENLTVVTGAPPPEGWSGKLWALEQGRKHATGEYLLLLDADIALVPGIIERLLQKATAERRDLVSLMAHLRMRGFWEKLLMPAFVYFFKMLYPFHLSNAPRERIFSRYIAAAAGGCILLRREALEGIGGFSAIKHSLIDDCALARAIKTHGGRTWIGLTRAARSQRGYATLGAITDMVARTAYTQLCHSPFLLLLCSLLMALMFIAPLGALLLPGTPGAVLGATAWLFMAITYMPTLVFYRRHPLWSLLLPFIGALYLYMTWVSALRHSIGRGAQWKRRHYRFFNG